MTKLIALILSFTLLSAQANTGFKGSLKTAFDDLNYSLTVEWDQQDKEFYNQKMLNFQTTILNLKEQGLTNQELMDYILSNIKDKAMADDLTDFYQLAQSGRYSSSELELLGQEILNRHYAQGSSWIGKVLLIGAAAILLITGVTLIILLDASKNPKNCNYDYVCDANGCNYTNYHCE